MACLAIPNTPGWSVTVDGQPVRTFRTNYGFIGFAISPGTHQVTAQYKPAGLKMGGALSVAGIALGIACCVAFRHKSGGDADTLKTGRHFSH